MKSISLLSVLPYILLAFLNLSLAADGTQPTGEFRRPRRGGPNKANSAPRKAAPMYKSFGGGKSKAQAMNPMGALKSCRVKCQGFSNRKKWENKCGQDNCKACRPGFCNKGTCIAGCDNEAAKKLDPSFYFK